MDRRRFLRQMITTCTVAVGVPAALVAAKRTGWENDVGGRWPTGSIKLWPIQQEMLRYQRVIIHDEFPGLDPDKFTGFTYYGTYLWDNDLRELVLVKNDQAKN